MRIFINPLNNTQDMEILYSEFIQVYSLDNNKRNIQKTISRASSSSLFVKLFITPQLTRIKLVQNI